MAPEYAMRGYLTSKADIYSYGVVALEIVSGKSNTNYRPAEDCVYLLDWVIIIFLSTTTTTKNQFLSVRLNICASIGLKSLSPVVSSQPENVL